MLSHHHQSSCFLFLFIWYTYHRIHCIWYIHMVYHHIPYSIIVGLFSVPRLLSPLSISYQLSSVLSVLPSSYLHMCLLYMCSAVSVLSFFCCLVFSFFACSFFVDAFSCFCTLYHIVVGSPCIYMYR